MDYEATDRDMASWVVSCVHNGTRFYLTIEGTATDIPARANTWRWQDQADTAAHDARGEYAWQGYDWQPMRVAAIP